ncbi:NAD-dependent epimerase/dehydratase family protein [Streptomyces sp. NPDC002619]|uniref:NAD-dependent epimerase/dehydratase family protein n=1 Tax=Streptomyces sp. NPDC002619 TaxID=3364655 RepID=UPI003692D20C
MTAHVRSRRRADEFGRLIDGIEAVVTGDLSDHRETVCVARQANGLGRFDAVIHNAGVGSNEPWKVTTRDGSAHVLAINALTPFLLTALIERPKRLVCVTSGMHFRGTADVHDLNWETRPWDPEQAYADSKLIMITLVFAIAVGSSVCICPAIGPARSGCNRQTGGITTRSSSTWNARPGSKTALSIRIPDDSPSIIAFPLDGVGVIRSMT